jgi:hypothetical protein
MAALTKAEVGAVSEELCKTYPDVNYSKNSVFLAVQAVEDWWELTATKQQLSAAIDAATTPVVFSNNKKKKIAAEWLQMKAAKEGA